MKLIDMQATLRKAEVAMIPLMKADTPNRSAIEAQIDKVVQARADLEKANSHFLLDIRMQLTPDQWKQLRTMHANRMEHREMHDRKHGEWGHDGGRPGGDGPGNQFQRHHGPPPPGAAPQGAPSAPPAAGTQPSGSGEQQ